MPFIQHMCLHMSQHCMWTLLLFYIKTTFYKWSRQQCSSEQFILFFLQWFPTLSTFSRVNMCYFNPFSAKLFKVDSSWLEIGHLHFACNKSLDYFDNWMANNADFRLDSSLRADSPESVLFAKTSIFTFGAERVKGRDLTS